MVFYAQSTSTVISGRKGEKEGGGGGEGGGGRMERDSNVRNVGKKQHPQTLTLSLPCLPRSHSEKDQSSARFETIKAFLPPSRQHVKGFR